MCVKKLHPVQSLYIPANMERDLRTSLLDFRIIDAFVQLSHLTIFQVKDSHRQVLHLEKVISTFQAGHMSWTMVSSALTMRCQFIFSH